MSPLQGSTLSVIGAGVMAEAIIACAHEAGVYVHESPELVKLLMQVDTDQHIPPELYRAVAEIMVWLYAMEHDTECNIPISAHPPKT